MDTLFVRNENRSKVFASNVRRVNQVTLCLQNIPASGGESHECECSGYNLGTMYHGDAARNECVGEHARCG